MVHSREEYRALFAELSAKVDAAANDGPWPPDKSSDMHYECLYGAG